LTVGVCGPRSRLFKTYNSSLENCILSGHKHECSLCSHVPLHRSDQKNLKFEQTMAERPAGAAGRPEAHKRTELEWGGQNQAEHIADDRSLTTGCNPPFPQNQLDGPRIEDVQGKDEFTGPIETFSLAQARAVILRRDIRALDSMISKSSHEKHLAAEIFMAAEIEQDDEVRLQSHARDLMTVAKAHVERRWNYIKLFGLLIFFALYCTALLLQRGDSRAYDIQSRSGHFQRIS
jgi:hypothetical protein